MRIYISSDHAGFKLKEELKKYLEKQKIEIIDLGPKSYMKNDDYPDYAKKACEKISKNKNSKGILICGAGHGMNIASNKIKNIRASVCWNKKSAKYAKSHTNTNILCLPARLINFNLSKEITKEWIKTKFSKAPRHKRRLNKIKNLEK